MRSSSISGPVSEARDAGARAFDADIQEDEKKGIFSLRRRHWRLMQWFKRDDERASRHHGRHVCDARVTRLFSHPLSLVHSQMKLMIPFQNGRAIHSLHSLTPEAICSPRECSRRLLSALSLSLKRRLVANCWPVAAGQALTTHSLQSRSEGAREGGTGGLAPRPAHPCSLLSLLLHQLLPGS